MLSRKQRLASGIFCLAALIIALPAHPMIACENAGGSCWQCEETHTAYDFVYNWTISGPGMMDVAGDTVHAQCHPLASTMGGAMTLGVTLYVSPTEPIAHSRTLFCRPDI